MKRIVFFALISFTALALTGVGCNKKSATTVIPSESSSEVATKKRYEIKSGHIQYEFSGMKTGTQDLYFDDWGWKESAESKTTMSLGNVSEHILLLLDGYTQHSVNLETNTATKIENTVLKNLTENNTEETLTALGEKMLEEMGAERKGSKTVAGHECDVWEIASAGTSQCVYKGVTLEIETNFAGFNFTQRATSVEFDVDVDESKFELPEGIEMTQTIDLENLLDQI